MAREELSADSGRSGAVLHRAPVGERRQRIHRRLPARQEAAATEQRTKTTARGTRSVNRQKREFTAFRELSQANIFEKGSNSDRAFRIRGFL